MQRSNQYHRQAAFTLIELMIVMAIIAVVALIALPSYERYVDRANRVSAQQFMLESASRAEEFRLDRREYPADLAAMNRTVPADIATHFTITLAGDNTAPPSFTVTATPTGPAASRQPTMTLLSDGTRTPADKW
ncbi:MAG: type IV pilin protein [Aquisalimonadaceae bacterium]